MTSRAGARSCLWGSPRGAAFPTPFGEAVPQQSGIAGTGKCVFDVFRAVWRLVSVI